MSSDALAVTGLVTVAGWKDFPQAYRRLIGPAELDFQGDETPFLSSRDFGGCRISTIAAPAFTLRRGRRAHVRGERRHLVVTVYRTAHSIHQTANDRLANDGATILATDPTLESFCSCDRFSERVILHMPRDLLPSATSRALVRPLVMPGEAGIPAIFRQAVQSIASQQAALNGGERSRLQRSLVGLFTDLVASATELEDAAGACGLAGLRTRAVAVIEADLLTLRGVNDLTARLGCSPRHLHNAFSERRTTPARYIWSLRLERAREQIMSAGSTVSIAEVAHGCGFQAYAHFSRAFKKRFGQTPRECWHGRPVLAAAP